MRTPDRQRANRDWIARGIAIAWILFALLLLAALYRASVARAEAAASIVEQNGSESCGASFDGRRIRRG